MTDKKTLSAKQVLGDIRSGMSDDDLMGKYALSSKGLQNLLTKMVAAGLLKQSELEARADLFRESFGKDEEITRALSGNDSVPADPDDANEKVTGQKSYASAPPSNTISTPGASKRDFLGPRVVLGAIAIGAIVAVASILWLENASTRKNAIIMGLIFDFAGNVAGWVLMAFLVAFIIAKIRKAESSRPYLQKAAWVALVLAILATIPSANRTFRSLYAQPSSTRGVQIIQGVLQDENFLTPQLHQEFWQILRAKGFSSANIKDLRDKMTAMLTVYHPLLWQDALKSLETGQPYKSVQRQNYETHMLKKGLVTTHRIVENDALMAKIARREAITRDGQSITFNEDTVEQMLANIEPIVKNVDRLFTPPQQ